MWVFYILSLLPLIAGAIIWYCRDEVVWWEALLGFGVGLLCSALFHILAFAGMTRDTETWSGEITHVIYYPEWVEEYEEAETYTDSKGNSHTRTVTRHRTHYRKWVAYSNIDSENEITKDTFHRFASEFGGNIRTQWKWKSGFDSGDHNIYPCYNETGFCRPVNEERSFTNRIKAAPTLFSFPQPPKGTPVFEYPHTSDWFNSARLVGTASQHIDLQQFDRMMAKLGPAKKVNLIVVGFPSGSPDAIGKYQQAKWIGGKKNDLVICYAGGGLNAKPEWAFVFGWTEQDLVKQNLQSIMLENNINNSLLPLIEKEVRATYVIKDWKKFDYITIQPPTWSYFVFFIVLIATQFGYYIWACGNECEKQSMIGQFSSFSRQRDWLRV